MITAPSRRKRAGLRPARRAPRGLQANLQPPGSGLASWAGKPPPQLWQWVTVPPTARMWSMIDTADMWSKPGSSPNSQSSSTS